MPEASFPAAATLAVKWVRHSVEAESWHIVKTDLGPEYVETLCGFTALASDVREHRPRNEKTCENCFRLVGGQV